MAEDFLGISLGLGVVAGAAISGRSHRFGASLEPRLSRLLHRAGVGVHAGHIAHQMVPESLRLAPATAPLLILTGYFIVHVFEHSWPAHFHFGEETHVDEFVNPRVAYTALVGLLIHTFFDGVSIAAGFLISNWLGMVIFGAVILHNLPEGFTMASIMAAAKKSRKAALCAVTALGISRLLGILAMAGARQWVSQGLALSAGVTLYVAASDLIPEVNKMRGLRVALTVGAGVAMVLLMRLLFLGQVVP